MKRFEKGSYASLLADIAAGDQQAFSKLYNLFYPSLVQYVVAKVNDQSSADDILQDLFMSVWRSRDRILEIESLPAYLYSSCRYLIIEHVRKSLIWNKHEDAADLEIQYKETALEDRLYYRYLLDMVNKEVENLPEKCRKIFKMSREEFKSNKEIAEYMGVSESTVENQINKALKKIRFATRKLFLFCVATAI